MKNLAERVVVVTGAASGIGRELAIQAAGKGARLALCDVDAAGLQETADQASAPTMLTETVDVADRAAVEAFRDRIVAEFGQVDLVINNAGVAVAQTIEDVSYDDFEWIMGINFWGVVYGTKAFLPELKKRPEAAVVNISSVFGIISVPTQGTYNASKFAVRGFTEALRHEMAGTPVQVLCVHPGGIKTNIARSARFYVGPTGEDRGAGVSHFDKVARTTPAGAARKIYKDLAAGKGRCLIGADAVAIDALQRSLPERYWSVAKKLLKVGN
ncbi:MAG: acetoin dehydrogenase [Salinisphaeraceae bacterium]|nr:acetoin dehydrogenase [Salinisphaeraceae bacterium]